MSFNSEGHQFIMTKQCPCIPQCLVILCYAEVFWGEKFLSCLQKGLYAWFELEQHKSTIVMGTNSMARVTLRMLSVSYVKLACNNILVSYTDKFSGVRSTNFHFVTEFTPVQCIGRNSNKIVILYILGVDMHLANQTFWTRQISGVFQISIFSFDKILPV